MNKIEIARIVKIFLDKTFPYPKPTLIAKGPFQWLISAVLSANSTDKAVNQVTPALFSILKDPSDIYNLCILDLQKIICRCGLFRKKSEAIFQICNILNSNFGGKVPSDINDLISLPLVGRKVALVVQCMAFNIPAFPVDTHIFRCANRWGLSSNKSRDKVEEDLRALFHSNEWNRLHLQIIYYGRRYCKASHPSVCPICDYITAFNASLIRSTVV